MGKVWRARHIALKRDDALKVLPEAFASDPERLARFQREAQVLASLNHPNIAHVYGLEESDGTKALVMELVEGPTLADRIAKGPISIDEALPIAKQIAEALEAAHEQGIIHRDLKPANIKVRPDGTVKVLDFGLAKAMEPVGVVSSSVSQSPTITTPAMTQAGVILGTAAYMSPEQMRGNLVDKRSDVWSFGCVLYEILTRAKPFPGDELADVMVAVLGKEPNWNRLPQSTPTSIRRLLVRCLQKDRRRRLRDIGDAVIELGDSTLATEEAGPKFHIPLQMWQRPVVAVFVLAAAIAATGLSVWRLTRPPSLAPVHVSRFSVPLALNVSELRRNPNRAVAVSADGTTLVFVGGIANNRQLFRRGTDQLQAVPISGTENGNAPFFSPDGRSIGFEAAGMLKKVSLAGGVAQTIGRIPGGQLQGASWAMDGTIVFAGIRTGLFRVSAAGGDVRTLTTVDEKNGGGHSRPAMLPGKHAAIFDADGRIEIVLLDTGERRSLTEGTNAHFSPTGHIVFARGNSIWAAPFDMSRLEVSGDPMPVLDGVESIGGAQFALSDNGTLIYLPTQVLRGGDVASDARLVIVDREGRATPLSFARGRYQQPRLAPDGRRLVVRRETDLWILELGRPAQTRLTFAEGQCLGIPSVWTHDGARVAFASGPRCTKIYTQPADSSGAAEVLFEGKDSTLNLTSWSRDSVMALYTVAPETGLDVQVITERGKELFDFAATRFNERAARFAPNGAWLAYVSDESGRDEVYVRSYPGPGAKVPITRDGGTEVVWAPSGRELFFRKGNQILSVLVQAERTLTVSTPRVLFEDASYPLDAVGNANYDVFPDGQRLVIVQGSATAPEPRVVLVLNWFEELKQRVPVK
jgi:Tol biopolymer transport system component